MTQHVAVNPIDHKTLRVSEERSDAMGDGVMCCVTFPEEFRSVQAHYPILFQKNAERSEFHCYALLGFENGENLFLKDGRWDARYVPLSMDIQPFLVGMPAPGGGDRKVVLDLDSPRVNEGEGNRIFDDNGIPTGFLDMISKKLAYLDNGYRNTPQFTALLSKYDLLEPLTIDLTLADGSNARLVGFHTIHEEKLSQLNAAALADLQAQGYLLPTYMALASLSHLGDMIDRRARTLSHDI